MKPLKEGDKVHWTETRRTSRGISMSTRHGTVVSDHGSLVIVKYRGRKTHKLRTQLRLAGDNTELTAFVKSLAEEATNERHD